MLLSAARFPWRKGMSVQRVLNAGNGDRLQPSEGMTWLFRHPWSFLLTACDQPAWAADAAPCPRGKSDQRALASSLVHLSSFP